MTSAATGEVWNGNRGWYELENDPQGDVKWKGGDIPPNPARLRRSAGGHVFGDELVCIIQGCFVTWSEHQAEPVPCRHGNSRPVREYMHGQAVTSEMGKRVFAAGLRQGHIARLAGCCQATVTEAFKEIGVSKARPETREAVLWIANELLRRKGVVVG